MAPLSVQALSYARKRVGTTELATLLEAFRYMSRQVNEKDSPGCRISPHLRSQGNVLVLVRDPHSQ
jgi:hypothetical protein